MGSDRGCCTQRPQQVVTGAPADRQALIPGSRNDKGAPESKPGWGAERRTTMRIRIGYLTSTLDAAATAVAIVAAPTAAAASAQGPASGNGTAAPNNSSQSARSCVSLDGTQSQCQSPGNAQIYDAPPQVDYLPYAGGAT